MTCELAAAAFKNSPQAITPIIFFISSLFIGLLLRLNRYRWFDTKGLPVVYPFGYGLSYTTFDYSNLNTDKETYDQADTIQATFTLTNTGDREGAEVAQLYVSDPVCSVMRPVKELKGFKKVFLKPGESRRITLDIPVSSLAFYSEAQSPFVSNQR